MPEIARLISTGIMALLLLMGSAPLRAQLRFSSLREVLQYADKNGLVAKKASLQKAISQKDAAMNRSGILPKVNLFGTAEYDPILPSLVVPEALTGGGGDKSRRIQLGLPWNLTSGAEITLPVLHFEKWEQLKRYKLLTRQTEWNTEASREALHIQLTQYYYQTLLERELIRLNQLDAEVIAELLRIQETKKQHGLLDPADYNRSRNLQLDVANTAVEYEMNYRQDLIALQQLLNLPDSNSFALTDTLDADAWMIQPETGNIQNRPAWKEADMKVAVAQVQWREAQRSALPVISLDGKFTWQWMFQPSQNQSINYDFSSIGLRLDFPLFQGNYYGASRQRAALSLDLARTSREQTADSLNRQQAEWWNHYQASARKQAIYRQKLETTADNLRIARLSMKEGTMEFETFNNIFQEYNKARMDYWQNTNDGIVYRILLAQNW